MDSKAIVKCRQRIRAASKAIQDMEVARTYSAICDGWIAFLTAWKGIYTVLEQGAKISPQSRQWYGNIAKERRNTPLLQYVFAARDAEEHGLEPVIFPSGGQSIWEISDVDVTTRQLYTRQVWKEGKLKTELFRKDGGPIRLVQENNYPAALNIVTARGNITLAPPISHNGEDIEDITPIGIAKIAIGYAEELVNAAQMLCKS